MAYMTIQEAEEAIANFERALPSIKQVISAAKMLDALRGAPAPAAPAAPAAPPKDTPRTVYKATMPLPHASPQGLSGFILHAVNGAPGINNNGLRDLVASSPHANPDAKRQVPAAIHYLKNKQKLIEGSDAEGFRLTAKGREELRGGAR